MIENSWGSGDMQLESLAPSKANDPVFMEWLANYFRSGASPTAALVLTKMNTQVDIIDILGSIKVPTLVMQRTNDIDVKIEEGRFIAERIEGARFVEFDGDDHLFWAGNIQEVIDEMKSFITNLKTVKNHRQQLLSIVKAEVNLINENAENIWGLVGQFVGQYRGKVISFKKDGFIAAFEGPSKAANCSLNLVEAVTKRDAELKVFTYIKEVSIEEAGSDSEEIDQQFNSVLSNADFNNVIVTETVKNLLSGSGLKFTQYKSEADLTMELPRLYKINDAVLDDSIEIDSILNEIPMKGSLLENVLLSIENHLDDESYSVDALSREVGMSERQLQRKLKQITNKTPNQLITSVRLNRAKELLLTGESNISEAGYETGFSSPSYFSKCFKMEFGKTPTEFVDSFA
jgi:AraC-like DNA-binding protein